MKTPRATIDFETRSGCSLRTHGAWRYSLDPTTEVLCLAWRLPHWAPGRTGLWHPAFPEIGLADRMSYDAQCFRDITELAEWIDSGGWVEAHNVWFEFSIWNNICLVKHAFPSISHGQWRCSAAKASAHALPRALEDAAAALNLSVRKDMDGSKVMKKMTKPRRSRKKERERWEAEGVAEPAILYHEELEQMQQLWDYCRQDVLSEEALSDALPDLSPAETEVFLLDLQINARGFQLDAEAVRAAHTLLEREATTLNAELSRITGGVVEKATKRVQLKEWLTDQGLYIPDTKGETIDGELDAYRNGHRGYFSDAVVRALEILRALGRSSTAKYDAMSDWAADDWKIRGGLRYHGASTGRWAGTGVQPHNFPRGSVKDMEALWQSIKKEADDLRRR